MNKDVDERLIQKGEFIEGYNIRVLNTSGSDAGAIENEKGNVKLTNIPVTNSPICIGSVADEAEEKIYWFIVNSLGYSYIFEYNVLNQITTTVLADERSGDFQVLNFDDKYKITGVNILYNTSRKEKLLLFTDGINPPRMVNIKRAKTYGVNGFDENDISLYKKPPRFAPSVTPFNTATDAENSLKENFFAFAYRYKYLDNEYSAPSAFTNYQFVPGEFDLDYASMENLGMESLYNGYRLSYNAGDKRVTDVQLLFKVANEPTIYVIDNINKDESNIPDNSVQTYEFFNKKIFKTLPADEVLRIFDDVPLTAKAQDIIEDRIVFGNTTSQYDLVRTEGDAQNIEIDYNVELVSTPQSGTVIDGTITTGQGQLVTFDLSSVDLRQGNSIRLGLNCFSNQVSGSPDYFGGSAFIQTTVILLQNYTSVIDFCASDEFVEAMDQLKLSFEFNVETEPHPDEVSRTYNGPFISSSTPPTSTSFTLANPFIEYTTTTGTVNEAFYWQDPSTVRHKINASSLSLKSNRTYEVGMVYLDKYGRYSSVLLPLENIPDNESEVFVPTENSIDINSLKVTVNHLPPYWADRYKFFIKSSKQEYYTIYGTEYYEDGLDRYVLLQGSNIKKVEEGQTLIVKRDANGPVSDLKRCKVLEIAYKTATDQNTTGEGWITGNTDENDDPIIEKSGTYMKIRPRNFSMQVNPDRNINYYNGDTIWASVVSGFESGYNELRIPDGDTQGFFQTYNSGSSTYTDLTIPRGAKIKIKLDFAKTSSIPGANQVFANYEKEFDAQQDYETTTNQHCFAKFLDAQTNFSYTTVTEGNDVDARKYTIPQGSINFFFTIYRPNNGNRWRVVVRTDEFVPDLYKGELDARVEANLFQDLIVFETEPIEENTDIYYETEEAFIIDSGYHQGNLQNQNASSSAIVSLSPGNCYVFGNGVEASRVLDDRFKPYITLKTRPNIALIDGYASRADKNRLIYSGSFSEDTGYNSLNEFNTGRGISKNLDSKYGGIQKIFARERDLIVFQEDRVSKVLYEKNILTSPDGSGSLTQIEQVLGQDVPYSGEYGISTNPESFATYEGRVYFTDANRGAVLRLNNEGITPISYAGMKSFFKEFLTGNKNKFNIGGFDPRNHQYVLTMSDEGQIVPTSNIACGTVLTRAVSTSYSYDFELGSTSGTVNINYSTSAEINISIVHNGVLFTNNGLTGSGTVSFDVTQGDLDADGIASVTIQAVGNNPIVTLTHNCPVPETMNVTLLVTNIPEYADSSIINRYKVNADGIFNSTLDIFDFDGVTRFETISGEMGSAYIPNNGDVVLIQSFLNTDIHTAVYVEGEPRLGYLVSSSTTLTPTEIKDNATYIGQNVTTSGNATLVSGNFTFNRSNTSENLFLIWDYKNFLIESNPINLCYDATSNLTACCDCTFGDLGVLLGFIPVCLVSATWDPNNGGTIRYRATLDNLTVGNTYTSQLSVDPGSVTVQASLGDVSVNDTFVASATTKNVEFQISWSQVNTNAQITPLITVTGTEGTRSASRLFTASEVSPIAPNLIHCSV